MSLPPRPRILPLLALAFATGAAFAEPEDLRQQGDEAWARAGNMKVPKPGSPKAVAWFCPKCNHANKDMRSTRCARCGHDYAPKPAPKSGAPGISPAFPSRPAGPVITPPSITAPNFSLPSGFRPFTLPDPSKKTVPGLPRDTLADEKDKESALLAAPTGAKPDAPKGVVGLLRPESPRISEAEWARMRALSRRIDALQKKGLHTSSEEIEELDRAESRLKAFKSEAIFRPDLREDEIRRLILDLKTGPVEVAPKVEPQAAPTHGLMRVVPPLPIAEEEPPSLWDNIKEDAAILNAEYEKALRRLRAKMQKKFEVRRGGGTASVRG